MYWNVKCILLLFSLMFKRLSCAVVTVSGGTIEGFVDGQVTKFLGIPYAEPPTGALRFKKPVTKSPWSPSILNCTQYGNRCPQLRSNPLPMFEDCLTLNVFVPSGNPGNSSSRAVMIWVHGGGYRHGTSSDYNPTQLSLKGDVIVVTMNYRLNSFGFLTTGDENARGNYGLWDQHMSFRWVKENIASFGGDITRTTIFGASAGGFSVGIHAISPLNAGLFQRALTESGTSLSPRASKAMDHALNMTYWFGEVLNCNTSTNHRELLKCLRTKTESELISAYRKVNGRLYGSFVPHWAPVVDGEFLTKSPAALLNDKSSDAFKHFAALDFIAGSNSADGALYFFSKTRQKAFEFSYKDGMTHESMVNKLIPAIVESVSSNVYSDITNINKLGKAIEDEYLSKSMNVSQRGQRAIDLLTDIMFLSCRQVHEHAYSSLPKTGSSYYFLFDHMPNYSPYAPDDGYPSWFKGANHVDERPYVFGLENYYPDSVPIEDDERQLSEIMMIYWTNFGKTGNPNIPVPVNVTWMEYKTSAHAFLDLNIPLADGINVLGRRNTFWSDIVPELLAAVPSTTEPTSAARPSSMGWAAACMLVTAIMQAVLVV